MILFWQWNLLARLDGLRPPQTPRSVHNIYASTVVVIMTIYNSIYNQEIIITHCLILWFLKHFTWTIPLSVTTYDIRLPFSFAFFFPFTRAWKKTFLENVLWVHPQLTSSSSFFFRSFTFWASFASIVFGFFSFSSSSSCGIVFIVVIIICEIK